MQIIIDTNIALSGFLWSGPPRLIIDAARNNLLTLVTSESLLRELRGVLERPKFVRILLQVGTTPAELLVEYQKIVVLVESPPLPVAVARDPDDDVVLACAIAAQVAAIVSGDNDLLSLGAFQGIPILTAAELLTRLATDPSANH